MPAFLPLLLIAIIVIVAIAIVVFLRRRRRDAQDAAIVAASTPVPELSEDDIAWRIGVVGADRPEGEVAAKGFAAAEVAAFDAAEEETGTTAISPPVAPVPVAAAVAGTTRPRQAAAAPLPNRWRLWRDSAAVLLIAVLAVLAVTVFLPGTNPDPGPTETPNEIAVVVSPSPTASPTLRPRRTAEPTPTLTLAPVVAPTPPPTPSPTPKKTPKPTPKPTARPAQATPKPTPKPTPKSTPKPTPKPTAKPTPKPTPEPTPTPPPSAAISKSAGCTSPGGTISFSSASSGAINSYSWTFDDGDPASSGSENPGAIAFPLEGPNTIILTVSGPGGDDTTSTDIVVPCP